MTDFIDRLAALNCFNDWIDKYGDVYTPDEMPEYQAIEALPAVPVREVRRGRWIVEDHDKPVIMTCSNCRWITEYYGGLEDEWNFCPWCGADMREDGE